MTVAKGCAPGTNIRGGKDRRNAPSRGTTCATPIETKAWAMGVVGALLGVSAPLASLDGGLSIGRDGRPCQLVELACGAGVALAECFLSWPS